jgi:hypothetical protein
MPTVEDWLRAHDFERLAGQSQGSCFGVTDASRLRLICPDPIPVNRPTLCPSCADHQHRCAGKAKVVRADFEDDWLNVQRIQVDCECPTCKK